MHLLYNNTKNCASILHELPYFHTEIASILVHRIFIFNETEHVILLFMGCV